MGGVFPICLTAKWEESLMWLTVYAMRVPSQHDYIMSTWIRCHTHHKKVSFFSIRLLFIQHYLYNLMLGVCACDWHFVEWVKLSSHGVINSHALDGNTHYKKRLLPLYTNIYTKLFIQFNVRSLCMWLTLRGVSEAIYAWCHNNHRHRRQHSSQKTSASSL